MEVAAAEGERRFHPWAVEVVEVEVHRHLLRVAWAAAEAAAVRWSQRGPVREAEEGAEERRRRPPRSEAVVVEVVVQPRMQRQWKRW